MAASDKKNAAAQRFMDLMDSRDPPDTFTANGCPAYSSSIPNSLRKRREPATAEETELEETLFHATLSLLSDLGTVPPGVDPTVFDSVPDEIMARMVSSSLGETEDFPRMVSSALGESEDFLMIDPGELDTGDADGAAPPPPPYRDIPECPKSPDLPEDPPPPLSPLSPLPPPPPSPPNSWEARRIQACVTDAFDGLVRGTSLDKVNAHMDTILGNVATAADGPEPSAADRENAATAAFVLWAQTRDIRGSSGKGERLLAHQLLIRSVRYCPKTAIEMIDPIPDLGSWRDFRELVAEIDKLAPLSPCLTDFRFSLLQTLANQLVIDWSNLGKIKRGEEPDAPLSLAGKWAPREKKAHSTMAVQLADMVAAQLGLPSTGFDDLAATRRAYRKLCSDLSDQLAVAEKHMCAGEWSEIVPSAVPAGCLTKKGRALRNLRRERTKNGKPNSKKDEARYPDDLDRVKCGEIWDAHLGKCKTGECKVHGRNASITDLVGKYIKRHGSYHGSAMVEDPVIEAQWMDMLERLKEEIASESVDPDSEAKVNMIALVDVSGSMSGQPMEAAIGLGLLVALLARHPIFRRRVLSFTSEPDWHGVGNATSLAGLVTKILKTPWGQSTNVEAALQIIIETCSQAGIAQDDLPDLLILSDMDFDNARRPERSRCDYGYGCAPPGEAEPWGTQYDRLGVICKRHGYAKVPRVIFWNLKDTNSVPVKSDTKGCIMMSGFSVNLLKLFMTGKLDDAEAAAGGRMDPNDAVKLLMADEKYDRVRAIVAATGGA